MKNENKKRIINTTFNIEKTIIELERIINNIEYERIGNIGSMVFKIRDITNQLLKIKRLSKKEKEEVKGINGFCLDYCFEDNYIPYNGYLELFEEAYECFKMIVEREGERYEDN